MAHRSPLRDPAGEDPELPVPAKQVALIPGPCFGIFVERHSLRPQRVMVGTEGDLLEVGRLDREAMALLQVVGFRPVGGPAAKHEARRAWARTNQLGVEVVGPSLRSRLLWKAGGHGLPLGLDECGLKLLIHRSTGDRCVVHGGGLHGLPFLGLLRRDCLGTRSPSL